MSSIQIDENLFLVNKRVHKFQDYTILTAEPAVGIVYIINNFISGHVRLRGRGNGAYPYKYLEMIDSIFGHANITVEACSGDVRMGQAFFRVDINKNDNVTMVDDAQVLKMIPDNFCDRWRCDPPYNEKTAKEMYNCKMPDLYKLLQAGARVVKEGGLLFLLSSQNYQRCPRNLKRIGCILITVVPNNEIRALNIYVKLETDISTPPDDCRNNNKNN